ncbi:hypothetical protein [Bacillus rhizoplanae]|uniref:hypothetical protein n=1 Tax=Bacillus rhizoplanae TaxID=2880966 RepID=UPI003D1E27EE
MRSEELNAAAIEAKTNDAKMWEIKAHYMPLIERLAYDNWYKMNSGRVYVLLQQSVRQYCGNRGKLRKVLELVGEELEALDKIDRVV